MPRITTQDGTDLFYKDWGSGRTLILIHGWPLTADSWEHQAVSLAKAGHRVIAYDRRGFGRSEQPWSGYDYDTFADDLAAVIETLSLTDVGLAGFSMGGGEIARYMSRHGGKGVRRAALVASVAGYLLKADDNPDGVDESVFESMKSKIREDRPQFFKGFFKDFYGQGLIKGVSQGVLDWSFNQAMLASPKATLDCVDAFGKTDFRRDFAAFQVPTLVIHGTADATVPIDASGRLAARSIPGAELKEYEGAPHGLLATHQERATQDLLDFFA